MRYILADCPQKKLCFVGSGQIMNRIQNRAIKLYVSVESLVSYQAAVTNYKEIKHQMKKKNEAVNIL